MEIYRTKGGDTSPKFWSRRRIHKFLPLLDPIVALYGLFSLVSSKIFLLATLARLHSIKFLLQKLEIWACNITYKSNYIFFSAIVDSQLPKCTKTHVKLHKSAHKMSTNCLWLGDPQTLQSTENWIRCTHPECVVGWNSALDSLGSLQRSL